ncbi:NADAR family protein [Aeromonas media]|uniref:NADAR family protein n=1 Tax=Aeromonas media TaxID=651 RepID=UPI003D1F0C79
MATITNENFVLFWRSDSIYSNWHTRNCSFIWRGVRFFNSEAALMYAKAEFFGDRKNMARVLANQNPYDAKGFGRDVTPYVDAQWAAARYQVMVEILIEKFSQNKHLLEQLLATGNRTLVEASPSDTTWGVGLAPENPLAQDPSKWRGQNLLGKALMEVRIALLKKV